MPCILVIEDDDAMRSLLVRALERVGYDTLEATNGLVGLGLLGRHAVDLIITDIIMPDMEGVELIQSLRRRKSTTPIIAISGGGRLTPENYLTLAAASGAARTLAKPFEISELLSHIRELLPSEAPEA